MSRFVHFSTLSQQYIIHSLAHLLYVGHSCICYSLIECHLRKKMSLLFNTVDSIFYFVCITDIQYHIIYSTIPESCLGRYSKNLHIWNIFGVNISKQLPKPLCNFPLSTLFNSVPVQPKNLEAAIQPFTLNCAVELYIIYQWPVKSQLFSLQGSISLRYDVWWSTSVSVRVIYCFKYYL